MVWILFACATPKNTIDTYIDDTSVEDTALEDTAIEDTAEDTATEDTAEDSGIVEPPPSGCDALRPDEPHVEPGGVFALSPFRISVGFGGRLDIIHEENPQHMVFQTPQNWLNLFQTELHVEEAQGSFSIEEDTLSQCLTPYVSNIWEGEDALWLDVAFQDCEGVTAEVFMCPTSDRRLIFQITSNQTEHNQIDLHLISNQSEKIYVMG